MNYSNHINTIKSSNFMSTQMTAAENTGTNTTINKKDNKKGNNHLSDTKNELNLLNFSRLYKIGQIPIMDFIIMYIILCIFNAICFNYDYKIMLVATIPLTILIDIIFVKNIKITKLLLIIFFVSISYLIYASRE